MNERDELARQIAATIQPGSYDDAMEIAKLINHHPHDLTNYGVAQAILAAGYRKPRTITTAEELDALGRAATILDSEEHVWTNDGDTLDQWGSVTRAEAYGGPMWLGSADIALPATVIHEPEPQP